MQQRCRTLIRARRHKGTETQRSLLDSGLGADLDSLRSTGYYRVRLITTTITTTTTTTDTDTDPS
jgi:hypothetical protein